MYEDCPYANSYWLLAQKAEIKQLTDYPFTDWSDIANAAKQQAHDEWRAHKIGKCGCYLKRLKEAANRAAST